MSEGAAHGPTRLGAGLLASILAPFALGYFLSYLYRTVNAVAAPDLVRDLDLSASGLGFLTAAYLLAFAGFQLPLGIFLDRFGPRRVQTVLISLTAVGALVFAVSEHLWSLSAARALIGVGCAGALMGSFKAVTLWLPEERRALGNSIVMAVGGAGIFAATIPAHYIIEAVGWRGLFLVLMAISCAVAVLIYFAVPEPASRPAGETWRRQVEVVAGIYGDAVFWRLAPMVALSIACQVALQTLWAGPWLRDVAGLDDDTVAANLAGMAIGYLVGTLAMGAIADWLGRRGIGLLQVMLGYIGAFVTVQVFILLQWTNGATVMWLLFGFVGQGGILAFPWLSRYFGVGVAGRCNTALNFISFSTAFLTQYLIGAIIDLWPVGTGGGYPPQAYRVAFGVFLGLQLVSVIWYLLKPPHQRQTVASAEKGGSP